MLIFLIFWIILDILNPGILLFWIFFFLLKLITYGDCRRFLERLFLSWWEISEKSVCSVSRQPTPVFKVKLVSIADTGLKLAALPILRSNQLRIIIAAVLAGEVEDRRDVFNIGDGCVLAVEEKVTLPQNLKQEVRQEPDAEAKKAAQKQFDKEVAIKSAMFEIPWLEQGTLVHPPFQER